MKNVNTSRLGFTLIELLVVVLIIGILAAVALPQYQKAVNKSRVANILPVLKSVYNAGEVAEMEGKYTSGRGGSAISVSLDDLDISIPSLSLVGVGDCSVSYAGVNRTNSATPIQTISAIHCGAGTPSLEVWLIYTNEEKFYCASGSGRSDFCGNAGFSKPGTLYLGGWAKRSNCLHNVK